LSYEVCGSDLVDEGTLDVSLEECSGNLNLFICDGDGGCKGLIPGETDYSVSSTEDQVCYLKDGQDYCVPNEEVNPRVTIGKGSEGVRSDTYFMTVKGAGTYNLRIASYSSGGGDKGTSGAPVLKGDKGGGVEASEGKGGGVR